MSFRKKLTTTYEPERTIQPIYTGGDVALDDEGRILATCLGEDALLTDLNTGQLLARIEGDGEVLTTLSITPTASHLILCSRSLSMQIYALQHSDHSSSLINAVHLRTLKPHTTPVITAAIDSTGTLIATGGADGVIKVWDISGGYVTHTFRGHTGVISALCFFEATGPATKNGIKNSSKKRRQSDLQQDENMVDSQTTTAKYRLATGSEDGKIRIWDLSKTKSIATLDSHVSVVRALDFSPETNTLVSGSRDKTVILWDAGTWKTRRVIPILEGVESVGFQGQGRIFYTGGERGCLRIWDASLGIEMTYGRDTGNEGGSILYILRNSNQSFLLSVHADQTLALHDSKILGDIKVPQSIEPLLVIRRISGTHDEIIDLAYLMPNRSLLALATNSEDVRLISLSTESHSTPSVRHAEYFGADVTSLKGHSEIVICLTVDWSGYWLATGAKDNTARLWRIDQPTSTYEHYATFVGHAESIGAIALPTTPPPAITPSFMSPLDHPPPYLLTGSQDRTIKRWTIPLTSTSPLKAIYTRKAHDKDINALAVSSTNLIASASQDRTVKIWSLEEGETLGILRGHRRGVWSVAFSPANTPPITAEDGSTSSNRGYILTGSGDKTVKLWSLNDYTCLRTLEGHTNSVLKVLWLPPPPSEPSSTTQKKPPQIASAGGDGLLKIWDPVSTTCLATLDNHTDRIWALTVHPYARTLVSGGGDSVITFWKDTTSETAAAITKGATERVEQDQELANHIHGGRYREAITLALALNHPARLLSLFQNVLDGAYEEGSISGVQSVDDVLASLSPEQLLSLLLRVRDWNTNARTAPVAQRVLAVVVRRYSAERLAELGKRRGGKEVVEALRVYTERHYRRVEELWEESWVVEFLVGEMGGLEGGQGLGDGGRMVEGVDGMEGVEGV